LIRLPGLLNVYLSQSEIQELMAAPPAGTEPGLMASHEFDEGGGQVAGDSGPNGYFGILGSSTNIDSDDPAWASTAGQ
jgi:hypothetical protein